MNKYQKHKPYFQKYHREYYHRVTKKGKKTKHRGEYVIRVIMSGTYNKKKRKCYGLTIPSKLVEKYKLLGKIFKVEVMDNGQFVLYTEVKECQKNR